MEFKNVDAWWYENKQSENNIIQPKWFTPRTHFSLYAEYDEDEGVLPLTVFVRAKADGVIIFEKSYVLVNAETTENYEFFKVDNAFLFTEFVFETQGLPNEIEVVLENENIFYEKAIPISYVELSGKITDFFGNPMTAPVVLFRKLFGGKKPCLGSWSNKRGEYSITVPVGLYQSFYVDDDSYGVSTLETWGWNMIVDKNEIHDFKIGNGEVYDLKVSRDEINDNILVCDFRPMVLPSIRNEESEICINGNKYTLLNCQPDINKDDITVYIGQRRANIVSLERTYELVRAYGCALIRYLLRLDCLEKTDEKQLVILEYQTNGKYRSQAQGRTYI